MIHKKKEEFRQYIENQNSIHDFYKKQHQSLTYQKASEYNNLFLQSYKNFYSIQDCLNICDSIYDPSDPDISMSQTTHAFQTALGALENGFDEQMVVIGLIHDLGKIIHPLLGISMTYLVGDSYPFGCPFETDSIIYSDSFTNNSDLENDAFQREYGIYYKNCGFDKMLFTGHDEMIYQSLLLSQTNLTKEYLYVVRYHSFYSWHSSNGYQKYANEFDIQNKDLLQQFQKLDLYTKKNQDISIQQKEKILNIVKKYLPYGLFMPE